MALYSYVKEKNTPLRRFVTFISYALLVAGSLFLFWSFYPLISFEIYSRLFVGRSMMQPVPNSNTTTSLRKAQSIIAGGKVVSTNLSDYTQAGIWFPKLKPVAAGSRVTLTEYDLSIPKLNIKGAHVEVGGDDLKAGLIHYLPVSEPGELGNISIFGHSTLPQLWKPNNDYVSIFTYLPSLEKGDEVDIEVGNLRYTYEVFDMFVVSPDEVSVLDQSYDDAYLTLITCVPPGTYWKRLVVKARLKNL